MTDAIAAVAGVVSALVAIVSVWQNRKGRDGSRSEPTPSPDPRAASAGRPAKPSAGPSAAQRARSGPVRRLVQGLVRFVSPASVPPARTKRRLIVPAVGLVGVVVACAVLVLPQLGGGGDAGRGGPAARPSESPAAPTESVKAGECVAGSVKAAGTSSVRIAMAAWADRYREGCPVLVDLQAVGSNDAIKAFESSAVDLAVVDDTLTADDRERAGRRCGRVNADTLVVPMLVNPVAVMINLPGVSSLSLSASTLAGIFSGEIVRWDDRAIAADNPGLATGRFSPAAITAVHRSDPAALTGAFTTYLNAASPDRWPHSGDVVWPLTGGVSGPSKGYLKRLVDTRGSIGYVDRASVPHGVTVARVGDRAGHMVELTAESATRMIESQEGGPPDPPAASEHATPADQGYPIVRIAYGVTCGKSGNGPPAPQRAFLRYVLSQDGQAKLDADGYAPLPDTLRRAAAAAVGTD